MKSIFLTTLATLTLLSSEAQITHSFSNFKNEIGTDVTALIGNFLAPDYYYDPYIDYYPYSPQFAFSYRHYFSNSGIKFLVNASVMNNSNIVNDTATNTQSNTGFAVVLGYEWSIPVTRMWEICLGPDLHVASVSNESSYDKFNSDYRYIYETSTMNYGFGPSLGIRWNFNERLSLSTESSLTFLMSNSNTKYSYEPLSDAVPQIDAVETVSESTQLLFKVPHSIFFNLKF